MLRTLKEPAGYKLTALDGDIGHCHDFLFDDSKWTVRYMVADTGRWLPGSKVLISPAFLESPDWETQRFPVRLTQQQIEDSPPLDSDAPVSRRYEQTYHDFFTTPYYWMGNALWGNHPFPGMTVPPPVAEPQTELPTLPEEQPDATRLRSVREVTGYRVAARDGEAARRAGSPISWSTIGLGRKVRGPGEVAAPGLEEGARRHRMDRGSELGRSTGAGRHPGGADRGGAGARSPHAGQRGAGERPVRFLRAPSGQGRRSSALSVVGTGTARSAGGSSGLSAA